MVRSVIACPYARGRRRLQERRKRARLHRESAGGADRVRPSGVRGEAVHCLEVVDFRPCPDLRERELEQFGNVI
jgi:hypothetical protein